MKSTRPGTADVAAALEFSPPHLSFYQLTIEPGTRFAALHAAGKLASMWEAAGDNRGVQRTLERVGQLAKEFAHRRRAGRQRQLERDKADVDHDDIGPRWQALAAKGAQTQRVLWASTSTKNPHYRIVSGIGNLRQNVQAGPIVATIFVRRVASVTVP